jgi:Tfp pilus assembly protein PilW
MRGLTAGVRRRNPAREGERGLSVVEILVGAAIMFLVSGTISSLMGAAVRGKMITAGRTADTEVARRALDWMAERLRDAALNLVPSAQTQARCKDRVVAQDSVLLPTAGSVFVSGEILNTNAVAGDEDATVGYYLGADPVTGRQVIMEYNQPCGSGATSLSAYSTALTDPAVAIQALGFQYYDATGTQVTNLTSIPSIRQIAAIAVSLTVQAAQGTSGPQTETLTDIITFRNPEPNANAWLDFNENF